jgi:hypothetical protein
MKMSKSFMSGPSGMFSYVMGFGASKGNNQIIYVWKKTPTLLWEVWRENEILRTYMGVMGIICCFVQLLKVKDLVRNGLSSRVKDHFITYELPHKRTIGCWNETRDF